MNNQGNQGYEYNANNNNRLYEGDMMRKTAKENKFLNQKDRIQDMNLQDLNYVTKHAARFGIDSN